MNNDEIRKQQREAWNKFSAGWKKHDSFVTRWLQPIGNKLLDVIQLREGYVVLDAATGTGEPGLSAAKRVGKGKVVGCDVATDMVRIAEEKAQTGGIYNYQGKVCNESSLPFPDNYFDAVVCRFGIMFFPNMAMGVKELARVLKPGRKISMSAWAEPYKNPLITTPTRIINQMRSLPPPASDAPGPFRCSASGTLSTLLKQGGFHSINEVDVSGEVVFDSPSHYWEFVTEVLSAVATPMAKVDGDQRELVKRAVVDAIQTYEKQSKISLPWTSWIASGVK